MTSIHDDDPGSPRTRSRERLAAIQLEYERLARRTDALEAVLAVGRVGWCRMRPGRDELEAHSQFKAEWGFPPDATVRWSQLTERLAAADRDRLRDGARQTLETGAPLDLTVRVEVPGTETRWLALRGRASNDFAGERRDLILVSSDVTAERRAAECDAAERAEILERERRARELAEAANRAKDEFLSVISHELRSPLNAILGWNRILALKHSEDPGVAAITPRIERSAKAQLKIVNDLLDLGRVGTGKLQIESRPLSLAQVAGLAIEAARPAAAAKGIAIETRFAAGAGKLRADPDRLQQVVGNLLSNAVKFTGSGGGIVVAVTESEGCAELTVQDTGQGIAPELLPHVFDRFRQGDSSSSRQTGGLGLGLALVREIVTLHGGTVSVRSGGPGLGTTFVVRLPAARPWSDAIDSAPAAGATEPAHEQALEGISVLVVDDEVESRTIVAETLRLEGAQVVVAESARAALQRLEARDPHIDIVVTDIGMPEEDGYSLVRKLRLLPGGRRLLAIAVTGYVSRSDVAAAMEAGFDLHVPKPVDFDSFVPLVRRLAVWRRSRAVRE
jgi:signal transduction histidine kinase/CheY-like chemotaxis protein